MDLPKRKHPRLKTYDYSAPGYYYITIHLSKDGPRLSAVGRGLDPADVSIKLTAAGRIAQEQLQKLSTRFHFLRLDKYVIMPAHIHAILVFDADTAGAMNQGMLAPGKHEYWKIRCALQHPALH